MKFSSEELIELTMPDGGRFSVEGIEQAFNFCRNMTISHYENFPVASLLIPRSYRNSVFSVYAFARIADDIADEPLDISAEDRLKALDSLEALISVAGYAKGRFHNPIALALGETIKSNDLPLQPFQKLIKAFRQDIRFEQPVDFNDLLAYCSYSANPVGELILRLFKLYDSNTSSLSESICTGLQLVNFWQDLSRDINIGRLYIPQEILQNEHINKENLQDLKKSPILRQCLTEIYDYTEKFFDAGEGLLKHLKPLRLKLEIAATIAGGKIVLLKIRDLENDVFIIRPEIRKKDILRIIIETIKLMFR
ncbi:MAG: hydroxysqualene synthase [Bacteroidota bacterium]|nr:hydroxysqualene synthase [Bacteroidota bacterium]